jgi:hypothetical protein
VCVCVCVCDVVQVGYSDDVADVCDAAEVLDLCVCSTVARKICASGADRSVGWLDDAR